MTTESPFSGVPEPLRLALEGRGFAAFTPVQRGILDALGDDEQPRSLRISSQTGSGKTVALGIAIAREALRTPHDGSGPQALIITPTRELAVQVQSELDWLFARTEITSDVVTGGTDVRREKARLRRNPRVLVGTPGRLLDHISSGALDCSHVADVVLDEADQMLDMGFKDELDAIVDKLPEERRSHLVSATFPAAVRQLAERFQKDPLHVEGTKLGAANADIAHIVYLVSPTERYAALVNLLLQHWGERCLVFVTTRSETAELSERLAGDGFSALPFSGDLAQAQRTRTLSAFRNGIINTLIATDVAARGIDVPDIAVVIHTDLPKEVDTYTHRSGRTGRAGRTGKSLILITPQRERRARQLLGAARVDAAWAAVPSAKKIRQQITKETRRRLYERLGEEVPPAEPDLEYASNLLSKNDPSRVVALLLQMAETPLPREPMEISLLEARRDSGPRNAGQLFTRFVVTWGSKHGANPSRILSHACRRGNIRGSDIGNIEVNLHNSVIEVSDTVANSFERVVKKPDPRDPKVTITRERGRTPRDDSQAARPPQRTRSREAIARPDGQPRVPRAARGRRTRPSRGE